MRRDEQPPLGRTSVNHQLLSPSYGRSPTFCEATTSRPITARSSCPSPFSGVWNVFWHSPRGRCLPSYAEKQGRAEPGAVRPAESGAELRQHIKARYAQAHWQSRQHSPRIFMPIFRASRPRSVTSSRRFDFVTQIDRLGQGEAALPRHRAVHEDRSAPGQSRQRSDGYRLRGADAAVRRTVERDGRGAFHAARGHPPDGRPIFVEDNEALTKPGVVRTIYDPRRAPAACSR